MEHDAAITIITDPSFREHDTGGNDTIDFSGSTAGTILDMRAGHFSSVNGHSNMRCPMRGIATAAATGTSHSQPQPTASTAKPPTVSRVEKYMLNGQSAPRQVVSAMPAARIRTNTTR